MKKRRLFAAILLASALLLGLCTAVSAQEAPTVDITKIYSLLNEGTTAPEETFTFQIAKYSVTDSSCTLAQMPMLKLGDKDAGEVTIVYDQTEGKTATAAGASQKVPLTFPVTADTKPGLYIYKITETAGTTAGVVYDGKTVYANVLVLNGENGVYVDSVRYTVEGGKLGDGEGFSNSYQAVKELTVQKTVTGNLGDKSKYFAVDVTLSKAGEAEQTFSVTGGSNQENPTEITAGTQTTFYLKDGETLRIANVPYGITYTVKEQDYTAADNGGYDAAKYTLNGTSQGTASIDKEEVDADTEAVQIINNKGTQIDTGVVLDNLPYILLLVIVIAAAAVWFLRRRMDTDRD